MSALLADHEIAARCDPALESPMITPFYGRQVRWIEDYGLVMGRPSIKVISYGLSSYGYDVRLGNQFQVFTPALDGVHLAVDPKEFHPAFMREIEVEDHAALLIPPNSYALGHSVERFSMPEDVTGVCVGKSTYARCGVIVNVTPLEAGWQGYVTIEISNATSLPIKVYAGEGIMQVLFFQGEPCRVSYASRAGKYQGQRAEVTNARL